MTHRAPHIGLTGPAGAGKTTAAAWFVKIHKHHTFQFAAPLKKAVFGLIDHLRPHDHPHRTVWYINDPVGKQTPIDFMGGLTARYLMQTLGTEWGRNTIDKDFWVLLAAAKMNRAIRAYKKRDLRYVIEDMRFENEADLIRALGGTILRIERPGHTQLADTEAAHASETAPPAPDLVIVNDGTIDDLHAKLAQHFPPPSSKT